MRCISMSFWAIGGFFKSFAAAAIRVVFCSPAVFQDLAKMFADLAHLHHLTQLHIDFGAAQIGISNGSVIGTDHAGATSTDQVGTKGEAGLSGGVCFRSSHVDNVIGSDINGSDGQFGNGDDIDQGNWFMHSHYLMTDQFTGPTGTGDDFVPGGRGMFGDYAIHALWSDTTNMDNLRGAAAGVAGGLETIPIGCGSTGVDTTNAGRSFSCVHAPTQYQNNDTDNQAYWGHVRPSGNGVTSPGVWGDNGWQRAGPGPHDYTVGDFGAGSGGVPQSAFS